MVILFLLFLSAYANEHISINPYLYKNGSKEYLAIEFKNAPNWHTYWINPGDAGTAINLKIFKDNEQTKIEKTLWPSPTHFVEGGLIHTQGYKENYILFYEGNYTGFKAQIDFLICQNVCLPGHQEIDLSKLEEKNVDSYWNKLPEHLESTPEGLKLKLIADKKNELYFSYNVNKMISHDQEKSVLLTYPHPLINSKNELQQENKKNYKMPIEWFGIYETPAIPKPTLGVLKKPLKVKFHYWDHEKSKGQIFEHEFHTIEPESTTIASNDDSQEQRPSSSLYYYFLMAFLGGIILNFMPCVLPVLTLKLFSLAQNPDNKKHHFFYALGIISTFSIFGIVIGLMKHFGEHVGWGLHMQSPYFIYIISLVLFFLGLNLWGVFEIQTPGGNYFGSMQVKNTYLGSILSGALTTILSTPCTAPFLGTALTMAFQSNPLAIFFLFNTIGLGLCLPFLLLGIFPINKKFIPKPGEWMNDLKKILGLCLWATLIWLWTIFFSLTNQEYNFSFLLVHLCIAFLLIFKFFNPLIRKTICIAILCVPFSFIGKEQIPPLAWSNQNLFEFKEKKQWVFMDFTAKWCITCKVNEKLVINTDSFQDYLHKNSIQFMVGDWTNKDKEITQFLEKYKVYGVPAYFLQAPNGCIKYIGETISIDKISQYFVKNNIEC